MGVDPTLLVMTFQVAGQNLSAPKRAEGLRDAGRGCDDRCVQHRASAGHPRRGHPNSPTGASIDVLRRSFRTPRGSVAISLCRPFHEDVLAGVGGLLMEWADALDRANVAVVHTREARSQRSFRYPGKSLDPGRPYHGFSRPGGPDLIAPATPVPPGTRRRATRRRSRQGSLGRRSWPGWCTARHRRSCASSHAGSFLTGFSADGRRRSRS